MSIKPSTFPYLDQFDQSVTPTAWKTTSFKCMYGCDLTSGGTSAADALFTLADHHSTEHPYHDSPFLTTVHMIVDWMLPGHDCGGDAKRCLYVYYLAMPELNTLVTHRAVAISTVHALLGAPLFARCRCPREKDPIKEPWDDVAYFARIAESAARGLFCSTHRALPPTDCLPAPMAAYLAHCFSLGPQPILPADQLGVYYRNCFDAGYLAVEHVNTKIACAAALDLGRMISPSSLLKCNKVCKTHPKFVACHAALRACSTEKGALFVPKVVHDHGIWIGGHDHDIGSKRYEVRVAAKACSCTLPTYDALLEDPNPIGNLYRVSFTTALPLADCVHLLEQMAQCGVMAAQILHTKSKTHLFAAFETTDDAVNRAKLHFPCSLHRQFEKLEDVIPPFPGLYWQVYSSHSLYVGYGFAHPLMRCLEPPLGFIPKITSWNSWDDLQHPGWASCSSQFKKMTPIPCPKPCTVADRASNFMWTGLDAMLAGRQRGSSPVGPVHDSPAVSKIPVHAGPALLPTPVAHVEPARPEPPAAAPVAAAVAGGGRIDPPVGGAPPAPPHGGPGPDPAPAPRAIVPARAAPARANFLDAARSFRMRVPKEQKDKKAVLAQFGHSCLDCPAPATFNPHHLSAELRKLAIVQAMAVGYDNGHRHFLAFQGGDRCHRLHSQLDCGDTTMLVYQPINSVLDTARMRGPHVFSDRLPERDAFDCILMTDVYTMDNAGTAEAFMPKHVADLLRLDDGSYPVTNCGLLWTGWHFNGPAGTIFDEGAWLRQGQTIRAKPHHTAPDIPDKPPVNWIHSPGILSIDADRWLTWALVKSYDAGTVLDTVAFSIIDHELPAVPRANRNAQCVLGPFVERTTWAAVAVQAITTYSVFDRIKTMFGHVEHNALMPAHLHQRFRSNLLMKNMAFYTLNGISHDVKSAFERDMTFMTLSKCFPETVPTAFQAVLATVYDTVPQTSRSTKALHEFMGDDFVECNANSSALGMRRPDHFRFTGTQLAIMGGCLAALWAVSKIASFRRYSIKAAAATVSCAPISTWSSYAWEMAKFVGNVVDTFVGGTWGWVTQNPVVFHTVVVAPIIEEWFKRLHPACEALLIGAEFYQYSQILPPLGLIAHSAKHYGWTRMPYWLAVASHSAHNIAVLEQSPSVALALAIFPLFFMRNTAHAKPATVAGHYLEHYYGAHAADDEGEVTILPEATIDFDPELCMRPRRVESTAVIPERDPKVITTPLIPWMSDVRSKPSPPWTLMLAYHGAWMHVCESNDHNLYSVLSARVLKAPPLDAAAQTEAWQTVMQPVFEATMPPKMELIERSHNITPWFEHFKDRAHKTRFARGLVDINKCNRSDLRLLAKRIKTQIKLNEALLKKNSDFKFRNLQNVNELVQTAVGPEMFEFYQRFKKWFTQDQVHNILGPDGSWKVTLTYAGAFNDEDLTQWMKRVEATLLPMSVHIIASGDDILVIVCDANGAVTAHEADANMFDQSQGSGVLQYECNMMRLFGVSEEVIELLLASCSGKLVAVFGEHGWNNVWILDFLERLIRITGSVNTSSGNSNTSLASAAGVFTQFPSSMPIAERYAILGLSMKLKSYTDICKATFLKGMWYQTTHGLYWGPLPSRILKIGKSVTPITHLFGDLKHRMNKQPEKFLAAAARRFIQEVLMGYRQMLKVPLLGEMCDLWPVANGHMHIPADGYQISASSTVKPTLTHAGVMQVCDRYEISEVELAEAIALLPRGPFKIINHRVFRQLAIVDYY